MGLINKIGLGTVQFGLNYGISNSKGRMKDSDISDLLGSASQTNIRYIDTAPSYGDSELRIGKTLPNKHSFRIITKTPVFYRPNLTKIDGTKLFNGAVQSLDRLNQKSIFGLLFHQADIFLKDGNGHLIESALKLKQERLIEKIGVSIYEKSQLDTILEIFTPDIIQIPVNVFDQRFITSEYIKLFKARNIEIHARSIFLQGLLLMPLAKIPIYFSPFISRLRSFRENLKTVKLNPLEGCLQFALNTQGINVIIVGITNNRELNKLIRASKKRAPKNFNFGGYAIDQVEFINPARWPTFNLPN